jgi:hypothetical protein
VLTMVNISFIWSLSKVSDTISGHLSRAIPK